MDDIITYLDGHAGAISALLTATLVAVTAWYVVITARIAKSQREAQRPFVSIDLVGAPDIRGLEFYLGNDGERPAQDVRLRLVSVNHDNLRTGLSALPPFSSGVTYLAPGRRYRYQLFLDDRSVWERESNDHVVVNMKISYRHERRPRPYEHDVSFDLTALDGVLLSSWADPLEQIARGTRDIVSELRRSRSTSSLPIRPKWCAACGSSILPNARKCPHCLEWQPTKKVKKVKPAERAADGAAGEAARRPMSTVSHHPLLRVARSFAESIRTWRSQIRRTRS